MRKALIALLMAATVATPVAAQERGRDRGGRDGFVQRVQGATQNRVARPEPQVQRQAQPRPERTVSPERQAQRSERREARQTQRAEGQPQRQRVEGQRPQGQRFEGQRAGGSRDVQANRPPRVQVQTPAASWPGQQERANRAVNRAVRQTDRIERRDDRRDDRYERRDDRRDNRYERQDDRRDNRYERRDDRRDWHNDRRDSRPNWNRNWRNDNRYDWQRYRYSNRNLFRPGRYYAPYNNYRYSRFSIGLFLGSAFYSNRYWISDPWQYRLPPAYAGTQWVRYYDDVMLIDIYTGEVLDVIYDFFW